MLKEGDKAPDFQVHLPDGEHFRLADHIGSSVVVYFYPKDDTSGCTREAKEFDSSRADFAAVDTHVIGISPDDLASHENFSAKHGLSLPLGSDPDRAVIDLFGVWGEKSMYGRKYMGVERSTFLIDRTGTIAKIWRNVKVPGHVEEVLDTARLVSGTSG